MRGHGQVCEDQLCLLVQAKQGEVVAELHGLDGILLLQGMERKMGVREGHAQSLASIHTFNPIIQDLQTVLKRNKILLIRGYKLYKSYYRW